jgi:cytochrome b subunit of formate dehydrogenase
LEATVSAETPTPATSLPTAGTSNFGRTAMAIFATMVLLIVALTGILVETTWHGGSSSIEMTTNDPGSVARR